MNGFFRLTVANCLFCASAAYAQTEALPTRLVSVEGLQTRVWTAGLEQRKPGQPVIVLAFSNSVRPRPTGIPVAVVVTTRADRLRGNSGAMVRLQIKHQQEWALSSPNSLFVLAGHTGHQVHRDDPGLVVQLVKHVLQHALPAK